MARIASDRGWVQWACGLAALFLLPTMAAGAELRVLACEPIWAALATELGGDRVTVHSATTPRQDPHHIQARPSLIAKMRRADLLICTGADLEVGWLPVLLRQAGNPRVQPGKPGHLEVAAFVPMRDVPTRVDRSLGDIHPQGNPHLGVDPRNVARAASELAQRFAALDPEGAASHAARAETFAARWSDAMGRWERRAAPLRGMKIVTHHVSWAYLADWLGLVDVAHLEPKPGIPPSPSRLASLLAQLEADPPRAIVRLAYEPARPSAWLSERIGVPALVLPHAPGATADATDLIGVFDGIVDALLTVAP